MKKLYQSPKHKRHQARRARRAGRQRVKKKKLKRYNLPSAVKHIRSKYYQSQGRADRWSSVQQHKQVYLQPPKHFSFIENTDGACKFYRDLRRLDSKQRELIIDLSDLEYVTLDAVTVMNSIAFDLVQQGRVKIAVTRPRMASANRFLEQSGFYEYVKSAPVSHVPMQGSIRKRGSVKIEPEIAEELNQFAVEHLFNDLIQTKWFKIKLSAVQRTLIECMSNTRGHAAGQNKPKEMWWASVYCDAKAGKARFAFVDNGVGILKSGNVRSYKKIASSLGLVSDTELLKQAIEGKIPSRTKEEGRGEGLPCMKVDASERFLIDNLTIITNKAKGEISNNEYSTLNNEFRGTFIYWELTDQQV